MITIYIKPQQFFKNVDEYGNIFEINYPTRYVGKLTNNKEIDVVQEPYDNYIENGFKKILLDEQYKYCKYQDFDENLEFNLEKYNARKQKENEQLYVDNIVAKIRLRYSINDELAILRQATTKPEEFAEYNAYVEQCKAAVKNNIN